MNAAHALRSRVAACLAVALLAAATWWPRISGPIDLRWDGGAYFILGTSLAQGRGYRLLSEPGDLPSSLHPPLLPVLVAVHALALGSTDPVRVGHALRLTVAALSIAYAVATFLLLAAHVPRMRAAAAAVLALLPPQYVYFSDALYAETLFGLLTVLFFLLQRRRERAGAFLLSGACAVLAYAARTAGVALLAAWVADNLLRRDLKRAGAALAISAAAVGSWIGWIDAVESSPEYAHPAYVYQTAPWLYFNVSYARNLSLRDPWTPEAGPLTPRAAARRAWENLKVLPRTIGRAVSTWDAPPWVALPLGALVVVGLLLQVRRRELLVPLYVAFSLAAVCSTPFQQQFVRYVLPLYPFFALALLQALDRAARWLVARRPPLPPVAASGMVWLVIGTIALKMLAATRDVYEERHDAVRYEQRAQPVSYRLFYYAPLGPAFDAALDWLGPRARPGDVVAAGDPQWVWMRTGLKAVLPPLEADARRAEQLADSVPVRYLLLPDTGVYHRYASGMLRADPAGWDRVWRSDDGTIEIFERKRPQSATAAPG
jgi:hypothetical protein